MITGNQSWVFNNKPVITSTATVSGPFEGKSNLGNEIDLVYSDLYMNQPSYEQAHQQLIEDAIKLTVQHANLRYQDIDFLISGDLINQMTPTNFAARVHKIPFIGFFNACATSTGSLALAALMINNNAAKQVITGAASHNGAVEKQFRYPTEYGAQKPPTAQWSVTGAGFSLLSQTGTGPIVTSATIGRVIDFNQTDPFNMGAAMAPAAADTIVNHLADRKLSIDYYDLIVTGDLGTVGLNILFDLLKKEQIYPQKEQLIDAGASIYRDDQNVFAGGSGAGCSSLYMYGRLVKDLKNKKIQRVLVVATGSLLSPLSTLQKQSIPVIAHAVSIESEGM